MNKRILLGAIADDFTGATDLANILVRGGMRTVQTIGLPTAETALPECDAVVVALKSRTIPAADAVRQSLAALDWLLAQGCTAVGVIGYCWGGVIAYLAATRLGLPAVSYYGRLVPQFLHERPQAPLLFHFGERDALIPNESVAAIARQLPATPLYRYPAGHAFNRLGDPHGDRACAALAKERTLAFLHEQLGQGSP